MSQPATPSPQPAPVPEDAAAAAAPVQQGFQIVHACALLLEQVADQVGVVAAAAQEEAGVGVLGARPGPEPCRRERQPAVVPAASPVEQLRPGREREPYARTAGRARCTLSARSSRLRRRPQSAGSATGRTVAAAAGAGDSRIALLPSSAAFGQRSPIPYRGFTHARPVRPTLAAPGCVAAAAFAGIAKALDFDDEDPNPAAPRDRPAVPATRLGRMRGASHTTL